MSALRCGVKHSFFFASTNGKHNLGYRICLKKIRNILLFIRTVIIELQEGFMKRKKIQKYKNRRTLKKKG